MSILNIILFIFLLISFLNSIDDILADSDSDMSIDDEEAGPKGKKANAKAEKKKEQETYIRETEDTIVDLADPNAFSKITSKFLIFQNYF